jgi:hypothetical protein
MENFFTVMEDKYVGTTSWPRVECMELYIHALC